MEVQEDNVIEGDGDGSLVALAVAAIGGAAIGFLAKHFFNSKALKDEMADLRDAVDSMRTKKTHTVKEVAA